MSARPGLIAFDLDGTLVDSAAGIHASLRAACTALDVATPSREALQAHIGPPLLKAFRQHHDREGWALFRLYEGALELLQTLQADGWQLHVVTLKPSPLAAQVLAACLQLLRQPGLPVHGYVGDTAGDQRPAAEAGYHFIAAGYGYGSDLVAAHQLQTPLELLRVLAHPL